MTAAGTQQSWNEVAAAQRGDSDAFARIYTEHADLVFSVIRCRLLDRATAEDLTSETFLRAWTHLDSLTYRGENGVGAWLVRIAIRLVLDHVKTSRYRCETSVADIRDSCTDQPSPEDEVARRHDARLLRNRVAQLPEINRRVIELKYLAGLSNAEVADRLGESVLTIKGRAFRGLNQLASGGVTGVSRSPTASHRAKPWHATGFADGDRLGLGWYATAAEAIAARRTWEVARHVELQARKAAA